MGLAKSPSKLKKVVKRHDVTNPKTAPDQPLNSASSHMSFSVSLRFPGKWKINK